MDAQEIPDSRIVDPARLPFAYQDALNAGDADAVVALFCQDATMRTFSGKVLTDPEALRAEAAASIAARARLANKPRSNWVGLGGVVGGRSCLRDPGCRHSWDMTFRTRRFPGPAHVRAGTRSG